MSVSIVRLTPANAALLDTLAPDVFDHAINPDYLRAFLKDARHVMFLAVDAGKVVGMASAVEYFHPDKPPQLFINEIGVSPDWQKRGIGRHLTGELLAEAERRGCQSAWLVSETSNTEAHNSFSAIGEPHGPQPIYLYEWDLED